TRDAVSAYPPQDVQASSHEDVDVSPAQPHSWTSCQRHVEVRLLEGPLLETTGHQPGAPGGVEQIQLPSKQESTLELPLQASADCTGDSISMSAKLAAMRRSGEPSSQRNIQLGVRLSR